ncbi:MAG: pectate lyase, partial [Prevotella sp.]|nr:pectate lyase [Prevotella sp.]
MAQFEKAPAFPGAEGHGRFVTGGRGGKIVHVTNLNDSGTGSLRAAVSGTAKKIVVFDVAGVIALKSNLNIGDNTTIMGQTAPSPGITVRYFTVQPGNNNIIRFMRFRRGQEKSVDDGADAMWQRNKSNIILDHCSFSWSIDEVASFYDNNCFTMQWCTIAESLLNAGHGKGAHGYGGIWGGKLASFHHNMIAHVANRGPRFNGARYNWTGYKSNAEYSKYNWANAVEAENVDFRNCLMYNAEGTCYGGPGGGQINMVNNYFQAGPSGRGSADRITTVSVASSGNSEDTPFMDMTSRYYISGNTVKTSKGTTPNRDWAGVKYDSGVTTIDGEYYSKDDKGYYTTVEHKTSGSSKYVKIKMDKPCPTGYVTTHNAEMARFYILQYVGSSLYRDEVDQRYVNEATNGTLTYTGSVSKKRGLLDLVCDCNGYTEANFPT